LFIPLFHGRLITFVKSTVKPSSHLRHVNHNFDRAVKEYRRQIFGIRFARYPQLKRWMDGWSFGQMRIKSLQKLRVILSVVEEK